MPTITWQIHLEDGPHLIRLDHDLLLGRYNIYADGQSPRNLHTQRAKTKRESSFLWGQSRYTIIIQKPVDNQTQHTYKLQVDGRSFDPISEDYTQHNTWRPITVLGTLISLFIVLIAACIMALGSGLQRATARYRMPGWTWWFIFACAEIHLIEWDGSRSLSLAIIGIVASLIIALIPDVSTREKIAGCVLTTLLVWGIYFLGTSMF